MRPVSGRLLLVTAACLAAVTWGLLHLVYVNLPPLPWTIVPALLIMAALEAWAGRDLKARIAGREPRKPVPPLFVARMVVLAKATAYAAAVVAGIALGMVIYLFGLLHAATPRSDMIIAGVAFGSSIALLLAALYLENSCRIPEDGSRDRDDQPAPPRSPFPSH
jgi:hypothetical protein